MNSLTVHIVDDDERARSALSRLLDVMQIQHRCHACADGFLNTVDPLLPGCVVAEADNGGLRLQERLVALGSELSVIFVCRRGDVAMSVRALQNGAVDFFEKPYDQTRLVERIEATLEAVHGRDQERLLRTQLREKLKLLSPREHEVLSHVLRGDVSKVIARQLNISVRTVDVHRARIKDKLRCQSSAALVRDAVLAFGPDILRAPNLQQV
jgi:FixJ family two-component response regulator